MLGEDSVKELAEVVAFAESIEELGAVVESAVLESFALVVVVFVGFGVESIDCADSIDSIDSIDFADSVDSVDSVAFLDSAGFVDSVVCGESRDSVFVWDCI